MATVSSESFGSSSSRKAYQNDMLNPYFMHPSDNSGTAIVTLALNSDNYHTWSRAMTMALRSKNKLHYVDSPLSRPNNDDRDSIAWDQCNTMIMSWINSSIVPEISQSILWMDTAADVWKDFKDRFYQGDMFRISDLQEEIYTAKQGDYSISNYYTRLKKLWQEFENFHPAPACDCECGTKCNAVAKFKEYRERSKVLRFVKGLNEQYSAVRSQIMLMDPLPSIGKVYSMMIQQERQENSSIEEPKVLAATGFQGRGGYRGRGDREGRSGNGRGDRGSKICSHCGRTGHTIDVCYKKHGYPPHFQQNSVNNLATDTGNEDEDETSANEDQHSATKQASNYGFL